MVETGLKTDQSMRLQRARHHQGNEQQLQFWSYAFFLRTVSRLLSYILNSTEKKEHVLQTFIINITCNSLIIRVCTLQITQKIISQKKAIRNKYKFSILSLHIITLTISQ